MRKDKKVWTHKKFKKVKFEGFEKMQGKFKKIFILKAIDNKGIQHQIFNSHQAAKKLGWICK